MIMFAGVLMLTEQSQMKCNVPIVVLETKHQSSLNLKTAAQVILVIIPGQKKITIVQELLY